MPHGLLDSKKFNYILMAILVVNWGFEYIAAKAALDTLAPIVLVFFKYSVSMLLFLIIKMIRDRRFPFRKKDILPFAICAVIGDIIYFASEYQAMSYLPISVLTIVLALIPAVSIITEFLIYKRRPNTAIVLGIVCCVIGVGMVVGADFDKLLSGRLIGYFLAIFAVLAWNTYNFVTENLTKSYSILDLSLYQAVGVFIIAAPYVFFNLPPAGQVDMTVVLAVVYLGLLSAGVGLLIYVNAVRVIGVTPVALYSNMMPITSSFFSFIILHETIMPLQIVGGVVVITSACVVIWQKDKSDRVVRGLPGK